MQLSKKQVIILIVLISLFIIALAFLREEAATLLNLE